MQTVFFVGGTRSGKSELAEKWTMNEGARRLYVATTLLEDAETRERVTLHKQRRDESWQCLEAPHFQPRELETYLPNIDVILIDCLSMWLNNAMARSLKEGEILSAAENLATWLKNPPLPVALVGTELGQGMVPMSQLARNYRDLHGIINQYMAKACKTVLLVSCGLPLTLKGELPNSLQNE